MYYKGEEIKRSKKQNEKKRRAQNHWGCKRERERESNRLKKLKEKTWNKTRQRT